MSNSNLPTAVLTNPPCEHTQSLLWLVKEQPLLTASSQRWGGTMSNDSTASTTPSGSPISDADNTASPVAISNPDSLRSGLPRRHRWALSVVVVALSAGGAGLAWWNASIDQALATARTDRDAAIAKLDRAVVAGRETFDSGVDHVLGEDLPALDQLSGLLDDADSLISAEESQESSRRELTTQARERINQADDLYSRLTSATQEVNDAQERWELAQALAELAAARAEIDSELATAQQVFDDSEARVLDDSERTALSIAITAAQTARDTVTDQDDPESARAVVETLQTRLDELTALRTRVEEDVTAWETEQSRLAAAAAARASTRSGSAGQSRTGTGQSAGSTGGDSATSSGASTEPNTSGNDGVWVLTEERTGTDESWCMNEQGDSWLC